MNDTPFGGRHWLKRLAPSAFGNLISHALCHLNQLLFAPFTKTFHIYDQLDPILDLLANDERGNILKRI